MKNKRGFILLVPVIAVAVYLLTWPVPIEPVAWQAPSNPGYAGVFASNDRLAGVEALALTDTHGPEAIALDDQGRIYAATHEGWIVRFPADGTMPRRWVHTGGRPLGMTFDNQDRLVVADAFRGLLRITPQGELTELADMADGIPIRYANDVAVAEEDKIYFSDSSTRFGAREIGDTYRASLLDILEHGGHGRLLVYDPLTQTAETLIDGLNFPNGVAISEDQRYLLINETGSYRILRYWLDGPQAGYTEIFRDGLPGFPDNLTRGREGRYWVALISPRNSLLDGLADRPWLRKVIQRLPAFLRPKAQPYGHVIALDGSGQVVFDLQDPQGNYPLISSVIEDEEYLYLGSLTAPAVGRVSRAVWAGSR